MRSVFSMIAAVCVLGSAAAAHADATFVMRTVSHDQAKMPDTDVTVWLTEKQAAFATNAGATCSTTVIYRAGKKELCIVDHIGRVFITLDEATVRGVADLAGSIGPEALEAMKEQMASVPAEYRATMEEAMKSMEQVMGAKEGAPTEFGVTKVGDAKTIDGRACVLWRLTADGAPAGDAWLTELAHVGVVEKDFASLKSMYALVADVLSAMSGAGFSLPSASVEYIEKLAGFPVAMTQVEDGKLVSETKLVSIHSGTVDATAFEAPKGYREESLGGGL